MEKELFSDGKLYELILNTKQHEERQRDEINKYYTSLFTGLIAVMPLIEKFTDMKQTGNYEGSNYLKALLMTLSIVGIAVSISWMQSLRRLYNYGEGFDKLLRKLEAKYNQHFIMHLTEHFQQSNTPDRIAKQSMMLPLTFLIIFILSFLYNIGLLMGIIKF